jgi:hypothetical protein
MNQGTRHAASTAGTTHYGCGPARGAGGTPRLRPHRNVGYDVAFVGRRWSVVGVRRHGPFPLPAAVVFTPTTPGMVQPAFTDHLNGYMRHLENAFQPSLDAKPQVTWLLITP